MNKRSFLTLALASAAILTATSLAAADQWRPTVGLQSWTCRNMSFEQVVDFAKKHGLKQLQLIGKHIDPNGAPGESLRKKKVLEENGLACYTFGVNGANGTKEENRKLFEFAKLMGIKLIVVEPGKMEAWDNLEELVKEYDIKLAIHNHGRSSTYGTPEKVWNVLRNRDPRIGVCIDIGHLSGAGFNVAKAFTEYQGRVYDMHLKDKKVEQIQGGKTAILDVKVGTGDANYKGLFEVMRQANWQGVMAIETDNGDFAKSPEAFVTAAIEYVKQSTK